MSKTVLNKLKSSTFAKIVDENAELIEEFLKEKAPRSKGEKLQAVKEMLFLDRDYGRVFKLGAVREALGILKKERNTLEAQERVVETASDFIMRTLKETPLRRGYGGQAE